MINKNCTMEYLEKLILQRNMHADLLKIVLQSIT